MTPVDPQCDRLYTAQLEAFKRTTLDSLLAESECTGLVASLFTIARARKYWKSPYTPATQFVADIGMNYGKWSFDAFAGWFTEEYTGSYIQFSPNGMRPWLVAHEAGHILLKAGRLAHHDLANHGPEFAAVFIWGISALFGKKWSNRLKRAFAEAHIESICSLQED